jgi:probable F420-dependent oxidoreductase
MPHVRFAASVAATSNFATIREACHVAEAGGFDDFAYPDHLLAEGVLGRPGEPLLECFTLLSTLVAVTHRIGFMQTVTCNSFRHPGLLAKMIATLDVISGGRVALGIGAGWLKAEYEAYGYDFPPAAVRLAQLREAVQVVKLLWSGERVDYEGQHYHLRGAVCAPRPVQRPRPRIMVGGGGSGLLAVAAAEADVVNIVPPTSAAGGADPGGLRRFSMDAFRRKATRVQALAADVGRDPSTLTLSGLFFVQQAETEAEARSLVDSVATRYGLTRTEAEQFPLMLIGTSAQLAERLAERLALLELGYVVLGFPTPAALGRFAAEVLPVVRA